MLKLNTDGTPSAPPRLRVSQKEGLGSRGGAEARREFGLHSGFRASDGEAVA